MKLSVIIPARNEWPQIVFTIHSILAAWETSYPKLGLKQEDMEIIIVTNCSTDRDPVRTAVKGTVEHLMPRGIFSNRYVRVLYDPLAGNHSARNKGVEMARGEYCFLSDGHMSYAPEYFYWMLKACEESGGIVHSPIGWHGTYPPQQRALGYQYTIKVGDEWRGTWAQRCLTEEDWFYIPALGHCSLMFKRDQFRDFGGYQAYHKAYGGGEMFVNMMWWMYGSVCVCEPRAIAYHLHSERGYAYHHDDYIENILGCMYALGIDDWRERTYINYMKKCRKDRMDQLMERSAKVHQSRRDEVLRRRKKTFNELLVEKPWDKLNMEKFGRCNGGVQIFHPTWIHGQIKGTPAEELYKDRYENGHQKELEKFIVENLWDNVYKGEQYDKETMLPLKQV